MSWGTDNEWRYVASHFLIEEENPRLALVKFLDQNPAERKYAETLMRDINA